MAGMDVNRWQAARRQWQYTPVLWFFYRMVEAAYLDARSTVPLEGPLRPDEERPRMPGHEALLARDWIARSEDAGVREYISFPKCCDVLGLDAEVERVALLALIDSKIDTDTDECWTRLEVIAALDAEDDEEPLFDAPRVVPVLDQIGLAFEESEAAA